MARMNIDMKRNTVALGTNILDIEVPPELERHVNTGIPWFNDVMGGEGLTPSQCMLFTGQAGIGKTTFLLELADSLTSLGNIVLYNTGEESAFQVRKTAKRINIRNGFTISTDVQLVDVMAHLLFLKSESPAKQIVLIQDSIQALDDGFYADGGTNSKTPLRCLEHLSAWCKDTFGICIAVGHVNKDGKFQGVNTIKHAIDTQAEMLFDTNKKSPYYGGRRFEVPKNRMGSCEKIYALEMASTGIKPLDFFMKGEA